MKIKSLEIENIGIIIKETIIFNEPLMLFIGKIKQGKTTILNTVKYVLGDKYPNDILRHGTDRGHGLIRFDNSSIKRVFRRKKDGTVTGDKIEFILDGELQNKPTDAIKKFLNPFLLNQDFFANMTELDRNRYFIELFEVDVTAIDKNIKATEEAAKLLRATIKAYGKIDVTPVDPSDCYALKKERHKLFYIYASEKLVLDKENEEIKENNALIFKKNAQLIGCKREIEDLKQKLYKAQSDYSQDEAWLAENETKDILPSIPLPNTTEIDEKISDAKAQNERYKRYLENKDRYDEKQRKNLELSEQETQLRELRADKIKKLADVSDKCGIDGLEFDENANVKYEGFSLGMISTGQIMRLSSALKSLYPEGFGIELIDGAESTGMIYGNEFGEPVNFYIEKAKREKATILATVVGKKPAEVPEGIGVFIVEGGKLK